MFLTLILGMAAVAGLFLAFINRILSHLRRQPLKSLVALGLLAGLTAVYALLALVGGRWGLAIIVLTLVCLVGGEAGYRFSLRRLRGSPPVSRSGPRRSLLHPLTTTDLVVYRYAVPLPELIGSRLDGVEALRRDRPRLRIAHFSDLHLNDHLPQSYYEAAMDCVNSVEPDLIFITGDFVSDAGGIQRFPQLARRLESRLGTLAIFGNHDYWAGPEEVAQVVRRSDVDLIGNGYRRLHTADFDIVVAGCEEPWSPDRFQPPPVGVSDLLLVMSHSADHVYRMQQLGAAAVFSGHYHAGQFQLPGFGPLFVPSRFGRRFHHGHYFIGQTHLFVSAGMGASHPSFRLYCPPDLIVVDFYSAAVGGSAAD